MERDFGLELSTRRLVLRDFVEDDATDVHAFRADSEVARYIGFEPETPEHRAPGCAR